MQQKPTKANLKPDKTKLSTRPQKTRQGHIKPCKVKQDHT